MSIYAGNLHILQPSYKAQRADALCAFCRAKTPHLMRLFEWYSPTGVCLDCGQPYEDLDTRPRGPRAMAAAEQRARDAECELQEAGVCEWREETQP